MSRIFITGSSDGLGQLTARALIAQGHQVTLHARSDARAKQALAGAPGAAGVLVGDLSSIASTKALAASANATGAFDVVVHNAGLGLTQPATKSPDGLGLVFAVNTLAPYILTCLMTRPRRLVYVSSGMHLGGDPSLKDVTWRERQWQGTQAYRDSKLHEVMLALAVARLWSGVESNACDPGWVKTKLGGEGAPGSAEEGARTQVHLADPTAQVGTGRYWSGMRAVKCRPEAEDVAKQDELLRICEELSGVAFPRK